MARSLEQTLAVRRRQAQAVELRRVGNTYAAIAAQLGYSDASAARKSVRRAIQEIGQEEAKALVALQYERLNELLAQTWPVATDGRHPGCLRAVNTALNIMDRMDDLLPPPSKEGRRTRGDTQGPGQIAPLPTTVIAIRPSQSLPPEHGAR